MGRTMACQLGEHRIRVNTISPGYIYTRCVTCLFAFMFLPSLAQPIA